MGHVYAKIKLSNPREPSLSAVEVEALVDTGAITLCIPDHLQIQLGLTEIEKREITTADGRSLVVPYVGPVQVNFENRTSFTVGGISVGSKLGWDYMWVRYADEVDDTVKQVVKKPVAVYIEKVYYGTNFGSLGI